MIANVTQYSNNSQTKIWLNVNLDAGFYSSCPSFGNMIIQIGSPQTSIIDFVFQIDTTYTPGFQYYVLWGNSSDQLYGPFTTTQQLTYGQNTCAPFNVKCKIQNWFENICVDFVNGAGIDPGASNVCSKVEEEIAPFFGVECEIATGGPEDFIGDAYCGSLAVATDVACSQIADELTDTSNLGTILCNEIMKIF